jgi:glycosyltransferase involved in cell wall biosynthesis
MKISVITATYNSASSLENTLASFGSQTCPEKELIIIDGDSRDSTSEIIRSAGKLVHKWISEPDKGLYDALNKGIGMADGDVIGFLHSGDTYANPEVLEKIAFRFRDKQIQAVYGDLRYVKRKEINQVVRYWRSGDFSPDILQKGWMPPHPTLYMRREVYATYGLFDLNFRIAADYDLMLRVLKPPSVRIAYIPEVLVDMETGGLSNRSLKNIFRKSKEDYSALIKNGISNAWIVLARKNLRKIRQFF